MDKQFDESQNHENEWIFKELRLQRNLTVRYKLRVTGARKAME